MSELEEAKLVAHIKELAAVGYGYTRAEVIAIASDFAVQLGKRGRDEKCFSMQWFYSFMSRWPELHVVKPSSLSELRARSASEESITNYFSELDHILTKYNLKDKPHAIYNIDEKGINTEFKPPNVVAGRGYQPQTVNSERSKTVTVIGAGNALGSQIPPYFVFPGQRMVADLMAGKTVGADATVTPSGWSNSDVFRTYMKEHFLKFVQGRDTGTILVLYDGHRSHIGLDLIDWARDNNIVLFVLPPHCSHVLQPMDIGCFGPLQLIYNQECLAFSRLHHRTVTRYDVCALACKAYAAALSPSNLQSAFAKAGIYPLKSASEVVAYLGDKISPSKLYGNVDLTEKKSEEICDKSQAEQPQKQTSPPVPEVVCEDFFAERGGLVVKKVEANKKRRRNISNVVGGRAVTEDATVERMKAYLEESGPPKKSLKSKKVTKKSDKKASKLPSKSTLSKQKESNSKSDPSKSSSASHQTRSPQPGPSHINLLPSDSDSSTDDESESQMPEKDKCCVCKKFYAKSDNLHKISITNWAQCDKCQHWVHLGFCTSVRVVRKNTYFLCPCC